MGVSIEILQMRVGGTHGTAFRVRPASMVKAKLLAQQRNKLFSPDSLPFNDFDDVREAFHSSVRGHINTASLERAIHLSNLATFLWVILQPDEAHTLLAPEGRSSKRSTGIAASEDDSRDIRDRVSRRNRVFGMAWKRYWKDVIPPSMRGNKHSIRLWAQLSAQVSAFVQTTIHL